MRPSLALVSATIFASAPRFEPFRAMAGIAIAHELSTAVPLGRRARRRARGRARAARPSA